MTKIRRVFPPEFKQEAVRRVTEGGRSIAEVSRDVGVRPEQLRTWKKQFLALGLVTRSAQGESVEEELRRVKRELDVMRQERDFAKKAAAWFAKGSA